MSENKTMLNEEEAAQVEADFRAQLMAEHESRQEAQTVREKRARDRRARTKQESQILAEEKRGRENVCGHVHREFSRKPLS